MRTEGRSSIQFVSFLRNCDLQPRTVSWCRFQNQVASDGANPFFNDGRSSAEFIELAQRLTAHKGESMAIIVNYEPPGIVQNPEADAYRVRSTVLPDVDQPFLHYARKFTADRNGQAHFRQLRDKSRVQSRISAKT